MFVSQAPPFLRLPSLCQTWVWRQTKTFRLWLAFCMLRSGEVMPVSKAWVTKAMFDCRTVSIEETSGIRKTFGLVDKADLPVLPQEEWGKPSAPGLCLLSLNRTIRANIVCSLRKPHCPCCQIMWPRSLVLVLLFAFFRSRGLGPLTPSRMTALNQQQQLQQQQLQTPR